MSFNAFMPGADNWMRGQPMPGQPAQMGQPVPQSPAPAQPERNRPILNAFSKIFEYGAPEAFQQGRDKRLTRDLGNALAEGNYGGAAEMALRGGQLETGLKLRGEAETRQQTQMAEQRKAEAQGTFQLFSTMQAPQINQYAMEDPVGFERATGMSSEEYLQAAQQFQQYGMTPEKFREYVLQKAQDELGMESKPTEYGLDLVPVLDPATGETIYVQSSKAGGYRRVDGITPLPEKPDLPTGMRIGANGEPEWIPGFLEGEERKRASGASRIELNTGSGPAPVTPFQQKLDEAAAAEYIAWTTGGGSDAVKQLNQLNNVVTELQSGKSLTGPLLGLVSPETRALFNQGSVDAQQLVEEVVQRNLRLILGAQFTQKEGDRLIARAYNPQLAEELNAKRLGSLIQQISTSAQQKQAMMDHLETYGTMVGFSGKTPSIQEFFDALETTDGGANRPRKRRWNSEAGRMVDVE